MKNSIPPISFDVEIVNKANYIDLLGVIIDENLNWKHHIEQTYFKVFM